MFEIVKVEKEFLLVRIHLDATSRMKYRSPQRMEFFVDLMSGITYSEKPTMETGVGIVCDGLVCDGRLFDHSWNISAKIDAVEKFKAGFVDMVTPVNHCDMHIVQRYNCGELLAVPDEQRPTSTSRFNWQDEKNVRDASKSYRANSRGRPPPPRERGPANSRRDASPVRQPDGVVGGDPPRPDIRHAEPVTSKACQPCGMLTAPRRVCDMTTSEILDQVKQQRDAIEMDFKNDTRKLGPSNCKRINDREKVLLVELEAGRITKETFRKELLVFLNINTLVSGDYPCLYFPCSFKFAPNQEVMNLPEFYNKFPKNGVSRKAFIDAWNMMPPVPTLENCKNVPWNDGTMFVCSCCWSPLVQAGSSKVVINWPFEVGVNGEELRTWHFSCKKCNDIHDFVSMKNHQLIYQYYSNASTIPMLDTLVWPSPHRILACNLAPASIDPNELMSFDGF